MQVQCRRSLYHCERKTEPFYLLHSFYKMLADFNENISRIAEVNVEFTHLKIICLFVKYSLLATM